jgi:5-hydroxyisourate hydrolase-like protein (transthyretin family)
MERMRSSRFLFSLAVFAAFGLFLGAFASAQDTSQRGRKYKAPPATARVEVTVLRDFNGKPIENAAVVFHPMKGEKDEGNMELKTNEDGKTVIDVLPIGDTVRVQIIAKGFQTYGNDFKIDKDKLAIEVRMKRPGEQYSIYKDHSGDPKEGDKPSDSSKPN